MGLKTIKTKLRIQIKFKGEKFNYPKRKNEAKFMHVLIPPDRLVDQ